MNAAKAAAKPTKTAAATKTDVTADSRTMMDKGWVKAQLEEGVRGVVFVLTAAGKKAIDKDDTTEREGRILKALSKKPLGRTDLKVAAKIESGLSKIVGTVKE